MEMVNGNAKSFLCVREKRNIERNKIDSNLRILNKKCNKK